MTLDDRYNPYDAPVNPEMPPKKEVEPRKPVIFSLDRGPLIDIERRCFNFSVEWSAIEQCNDAKLEMLDHLQAVLNYPSAIFHDLQRENYTNSYAYSGKGANGYPLSYVIVVYVDYDEVLDELIVWDWEPKKESYSDVGHPLTWKSDLRERIWPL